MDPMPASWADEEEAASRGGGRNRRAALLAGVVAAVVVVAAIVVVWSKAGDGPEERAWPDSVAGRPQGLGENGQTAAEVTPNTTPGVYLWSGFDGWHLWVVGGDGVQGVRGTITSTVEIGQAMLSAPGQGSVSVDGRTITFDLTSDAEVAGVDFEPGFYSKRLTVKLSDADGPLSPSTVTLGPSTTATRMPVVIDKAVVKG